MPCYLTHIRFDESRGLCRCRFSTFWKQQLTAGKQHISCRDDSSWAKEAVSFAASIVLDSSRQRNGQRLNMTCDHIPV